MERSVRRAAFRAENKRGAGEITETAVTVLILFSGPAHRPDGFEARCKSAGMECVMVDTCVGGEAHDVLDDQVYQNLRSRAIAGEFQTCVIAIPCSSFSVARLQQGGPAQLRSRAKGAITAKGGLTESDFRRVTSANKLVTRAVAIARAVGSFIFEHPPDRGDESSVLYQRKFADHAPLWIAPAMMALRLELQTVSYTFAQCALGSKYQKWTTVWCSADLAPGLAFLQHCRCEHGFEAHQAQASGVDAEGAFNSRLSAAYPGKMVQAIVTAIDQARRETDWRPFQGRTLRGQGEVLHIGSSRPHGEAGGAARKDSVPEPTSSSLRRLEPAPAHELLEEPFSVGNIPCIEEWADAPTARAEAPPGPFTTEQLMPRGVVAKLQRFRLKVQQCFAAAQEGRWQWARDHRPEPVVLSEDESLQPAARGWTWLWDADTKLWNAALPSRWPESPPGAELQVQRIIDDAKAGGFTDMAIVAHMAHGYPGPRLERCTVIGPPHVGALKMVEGFYKCATKDRTRGWVLYGSELPLAWPCRSDPQNVVVQKIKPRMTTDKSMRLASWVASYNEELDLATIQQIVYVRVAQLARNVAILTAAGVRVKVWGFDLEAFFRKTAKQRADWWMSGTCQWDGYGLDKRVQFGQREAPVYCGRQSTFIVWALRRELDRLAVTYPPTDQQIIAFLNSRKARERAGDSAHAWARTYVLSMYVDDGGAGSFDDELSDTAGRPVTVLVEGLVQRQRRTQLYCEAARGVIRYYGHAESEGKCSWGNPTLDFLGVTVDPQAWTQYMTAEKRAAYQSHARELLTGADLGNGAVKCSGELLNSMVHKLLHAASCTPLGRQHLHHLMGARRGGSALQQGKVLSKRACEELRWWISQLDSEDGVPLASRVLWPGASRDGVLQVYSDASRELGDASQSGFGGWSVLGSTFYYIEGRWTRAEMEQYSINVLELHALDMLTGVMLDTCDALHKLTAWPASVGCIGQITHVTEFCDNTAAEHSTERGKPQQHSMQAIIERRYAELRGRNVYTHTERIASCDNDVADGLSRGGAHMANALRMMRAVGLEIQRVDVPEWRRCMARCSLTRNEGGRERSLKARKRERSLQGRERRRSW